MYLTIVLKFCSVDHFIYEFTIGYLWFVFSHLQASRAGKKFKQGEEEEDVSWQPIENKRSKFRIIRCTLDQVVLQIILQKKLASFILDFFYRWL